VYRSKRGKLPAETAGMRQNYVFSWSENMCISESEIQTPQTFWMQLGIQTSYTLAVTHDYTIICTKLCTVK
jgi:hypothetical protein